MSRLKAWKSLSILLALALVLSLGVMAVPMAGTVEANLVPETIESSQPIELTTDAKFDLTEGV